MIKAVENFWVVEKDALVLDRNAGNCCEENASERIEEVKQYISIMQGRGMFTADKVLFETEQNVPCLPEMERLFREDAIRTFCTDECRCIHTHVLKLLYNETQDYHQGLGFIVSYLLLFLPPQSVVDICLSLNEFYLPNYYKSISKEYVTDARAFWKMMETREPQIHKHITSLVNIPESFCTKWFVGLNIHVLPFEALHKFFLQFLTVGRPFLYSYGWALLRTCQNELLAKENENSPSSVFAILKLDKSYYPNNYVLPKHLKSNISITEEKNTNSHERSFFSHIVLTAGELQLDDVEKARSDAAQELDEEAESRRLKYEVMEDLVSDISDFSDE